MSTRTYRMEDGSEYVITFGCGSSGFVNPDGTWTIAEDHAEGCGHERTPPERIPPVGVLADLNRIIFGGDVVPQQGD